MFKPLNQTLRHFVAHPALPNESQCPVCEYFDISHPDVRRILLMRDPSKMVLYQAQCRCNTIEHQRQKEDGLRRQQANLPHPGQPRTFENFRAREGTAEALASVHDFVSGVGTRSLLLVGEVGSGKSHLLEALGRAILDDTTHTIRYEMASEFLDRLRRTYSLDSQENIADLVDWYQRRYIVLLDDLGMEKGSDWAVERLTAFIDERLRMGWRTVIATNLVEQEMERHLGSRLASRLFQANTTEVRRVTLTATDFRRNP